jgi:phage terminase small subunit
MMMAGGSLTPKQEAFARAYVETGNASEAYRRSYNAENCKPNVIWVKASEVLSDGNVAVRVAELQAAASERALVSVLSLTQELEEARALAMQEGQPSAAVSASMGKAKLHGLLTDNVNLKGSLAVVASQHDEQL